MNPKQLVADVRAKAAAVRAEQAKAKTKTQVEQRKAQAVEFNRLMRQRLCEMAREGQDPSELKLAIDFQPWTDLLEPWSSLHLKVLYYAVPKAVFRDGKVALHPNSERVRQVLLLEQYRDFEAGCSAGWWIVQARL